MPYDQAALDVLRGMKPPNRRWMTHREALALVKSQGCLVVPPAAGEGTKYTRTIFVFDLKSGAPSSIEIWAPKT